MIANNHINNGVEAYDAAGNLMTDGFHNYFYDAEHHLIQVDGSEGWCQSNTGTAATACYTYDAEGRRVRRTVGSGITDDYLYDLSGHFITQVSGQGSWVRGEIYAGGQHIATYENDLTTPTTFFTHADHLGTERVESAVNGTSCETIQSLPFGDGLATSGSCDPTELRFTDKMRDSESNLDNFGARYNSSSLGRFMTPDWSAQAEPVPYAKLENPQSLNLYSYTLNNPMTNVDINGHTATCGGDDGSTCKVTLTQITQNVNFYNKDGDLVSTVKVTTNMTTITNSNNGAVVSVYADATAANVSGTKFSASQLATIGSTVGAVQQAGSSMSLGSNPTQLLTAITAKESTLGLTAPLNPMQLSCSSGTCANGDREHNIQGALDVLQTLGKSSNYDPASTYSRYNGVPDPIQRATNVRNFMSIYNGISQSSWSFSPTIPAPPLPPGLQ